MKIIINLTLCKEPFLGETAWKQISSGPVWVVKNIDYFLNGGWMLVSVMLTCLNEEPPGGDGGGRLGSEWFILTICQVSGSAGRFSANKGLNTDQQAQS